MWQYDQPCPGRKQFTLTEQGHEELERSPTGWHRMRQALSENPNDPTGAATSYERNLTFRLRLRGLSEPEIAHAIDEVRAHEAAAGTPAEAEFGPAEECAKRFPEKKRRTRVRTVGVYSELLSCLAGAYGRTSPLSTSSGLLSTSLRIASSGAAWRWHLGVTTRALRIKPFDRHLRREALNRALMWKKRPHLESVVGNDSPGRDRAFRAGHVVEGCHHERKG